MRNGILKFWVLMMALLAPNIYAQDSTSYFPLHVGDFWRYKGEEQPWEAVKVVDTTVFNGEKYYIREHPLGYYTYSDTIAYDSSNQIKILANNGHRILYRLNAAVGDTWSYADVTPYDTMDVVVQLVAKLDSFDMVGPLKGRYHNVLVFYTDAPGYYDAWSYDYLVLGLGLIFKHWQMDRRILYGAVIDGKLCGDTTTTDVKVTETAVPRTLKLLQNYPNPFNPSTRIRYELPARRFVDLSIYDVLGRKVKTLIREFKKPGTYETKFEGGDLPSGIYFYRLVAGAEVLVGKAVLVK